MITQDQEHRLIHWLTDNNHHREADYVRLALRCHLRPGQLLPLAFQELQKDGTVPHLSTRLSEEAMDWIQAMKRAAPRHAFLFQANGNRAKGKPVTRQMIAMPIREAGRVVMGTAVTPEMLRKTYATRLIRAGWTGERVCELFGYTRRELDNYLLDANSQDPILIPVSELEASGLTVSKYYAVTVLAAVENEMVPDALIVQFRKLSSHHCYHTRINSQNHFELRYPGISHDNLGSFRVTAEQLVVSLID